MVVKDTDADLRYHVTFFPLNEVKSCELKINGFETNQMGEIKPNSNIELTFKIRDEPFIFHYAKLYAPRLINLLTNKILPNIKSQALSEKPNQEVS